jgi:predicted  nucleic acid-binding Zn-ribbon protein
LKKITSGQALQIVEAQKFAIMEAFSEQQTELEQLRNQLAEKQQEVKSLEQSIKVEEVSTSRVA